MTSLAETEVLSNVNRYLRTYGSVWSAQLTSARFVWNRDLPLYEVEIRAMDGRQGYLLVSNSPALPFVISKSLDGKLLSSLLNRRLAELASRSALVTAPRVDAFQYVVPFSFVAHMEDGSAIQIDDGMVIDGLRGGIDQAPPAGGLVEEGIGGEWAALDAGYMNVPAIDEIMYASGPYYNQAYNASCVISGCTAVAWATYAAWLKGSGGLLPDLFSSSDCWYNDWGFFFKCEQPVDECQDVDALIWWFNQTLGTVNGGTRPQNVILGRAVFARYGSPGIVMRPAAADTGTITSLMQNYPVLFCGVRDWQFLVDSPDKRGTIYDDPAGHCVVIHGIRGSEIFVNMGWGKYNESRWFNLNSISQRQTYGLYRG